MIVITPTPITDSSLVSTTVAEDPAPEWSASTPATLGLRVRRTALHMVYERLTAAPSTAEPETDTVNWIEVGPTNRWAAFDASTGTYSSGTGSISWTVTPGRVGALALLELQAASVRVTVTRGAGGAVVYDRTINLRRNSSRTWRQFFYVPALFRRTLVLTDLPPYTDAHVTITVLAAAPGDAVSVGVCVLGRWVEIGLTCYGASPGFNDYSTKQTAYGRTVLKPGAWSRRISLPLEIATTDLDIADQRIVALRGTLAVFVGHPDFDSLIAYGYCAGWTPEMTYPSVVHATITIEGMA